MTRALLALGILALALAAGQPATAAGPRSVFEDGGGCTVCRFYGPYGISILNANTPYEACSNVLGPGSHGLACAGWNYWDRTRVWKYSGGSIRVGFWYRNVFGVATMGYRIYNAPYWNGQVLTVDRTELTGVTPYSASTCAYDYSYGGPESAVLCEAIDW
jgi:hypothetical protein